MTLSDPSVTKSSTPLIAGIILVLMGAGILYWNMQRTERTAGVLAQAKALCVALPSNAKVDKAFHNKLVYTTGSLIAGGQSLDTHFGFGLEGIGFSKKVEYYQYVEKSTKKKEKDASGKEISKTVYEYKKEWKDKPVSSVSFSDKKRENTLLIENVEEEVVFGKKTRLGAYVVAEEVLMPLAPQKADAESQAPTALNVSEADMQKMHTYILTQGHKDAEGIREFYEDGQEGSLVHVQGNVLYLGQEVDDPDVGDIRITYTIIPTQEVSLVAKADSARFVPYTSESGELFSLIRRGNISMETMFENAQSQNETSNIFFMIIAALFILGGGALAARHCMSK